MAVYFVKGSHASSNEYFVSLALDKLKIEYTFQAVPFGWRGLRGEYIVDFVLYNPMEIPMEVYGDYWHTGQLGADDRMRLVLIEQHYGQPAIIVWGRESDTKEEAYETVRQKVGVGL